MRTAHQNALSLAPIAAVTYSSSTLRPLASKRLAYKFAKGPTVVNSQAVAGIRERDYHNEIYCSVLSEQLVLLLAAFGLEMGCTRCHVRVSSCFPSAHGSNLAWACANRIDARLSRQNAIRTLVPMADRSSHGTLSLAIRAYPCPTRHAVAEGSELLSRILRSPVLYVRGLARPRSIDSNCAQPFLGWPPTP